jgi:hypothetical protein
MATPIDICNLALTKLGAHIITSFTDQITEAILCNIHYPIIRDAVLEDRDWSFAIAEVQLVPATPTDPFPPEYGQAYALPSDCLLVRYCFIPNPVALSSGSLLNQEITSEQAVTRPSWNKFGNLAFSSTSSLWARYIRRIEDTTQYTSQFIQALACRLASELAMPVTNRVELQAQLYKEYEMKLMAASGRDGSVGTPQVIQVSQLTRARY